MNERLVIYLSDAWPQMPAAPWILLDSSDRVVQQGLSEPRHWPASGHCEAVLGGSQCALFETLLPPGRRRDEERLLRYALEDSLVSDGDQQHFTVAYRRDGEGGLHVGVLVIARARLRSLLAQLAAIGREPDCVVAALELLPTDESGERGRVLCVAPDDGILVRTAPGQAIALTADDATGVLRHALQSAADETVSHLPVFSAPGLPLPPSLTSFCTPPYNPWSWWSQLAVAADLRHGEFALRRRKGDLAGRLRLPLTALAAACAFFLIAGSVEVVWRKWQLADAEARMTHLFQAAVPNVPPVAPAAQLARRLDDQRQAQGQLRRDDFLALFAAWTRAAGADAQDTLLSLHYETGRLDVSLKQPLSPSGGEIPAVWRDRFAAQGLDVTPDAERPATLHLRAREAG